MVDFYRYILQDFSRTEFAYKAIKKINAYSENIDGGNFYDILLQTLISLNNQKNSLEIVEYWFELQLAFTIGEEVNLQYDNNSNKLDSSRNYNFDIYQKVFVEDINGRYSSEDIKFLRLMLTSTPSLISRVVGSAEILTKVKPIIESFIGR
ncbi:DNA repair protein RecO [Chlamydia trachomatis]|nr:DNA repair protein RecO [Chlamydia trachomatis]